MHLFPVGGCPRPSRHMRHWPDRYNYDNAQHMMEMCAQAAAQWRTSGRSCRAAALSSTEENTGSSTAGTLKLKTPTCFMPLWGCRFLHTLCLCNSVPSRLFTSTPPVSDLETAAVHLKVASCVLKEINKPEVGVRREFCLLFVSITLSIGIM